VGWSYCGLVGDRGVLARLRLAPDGAARPNAPFGRGPFAAHVLARLIDAAVWAGSRTPSPVAHGLATVGGHLEWMARRDKRTRLATNLAHAVAGDPSDPVVRRLVRRAMVNEAHRSADLLWALGKPEEFLGAVEMDGVEHAQQAAGEGRGVILTGVHLGGWELAATVPQAVLPVPTTALVADDWLAWAIEHMRRRAGLRIAYRSAPVNRLGSLLRAGEALVVLSDDASGYQPRMHTVRFLDTDTDLPCGVVTLARAYQAPIVGFAVVRLGPRRWRVVVDAPLEPPPRRASGAADQATLQQLADRWTELIRAHPDQWSASFPIHWHVGRDRGRRPTMPA
jgi:lauroyl/myristoyl acyltransferase